MPLNVGRFPVLSFLGLVSSIFMLGYLQVGAVVLGSVIMGIGALIYAISKGTQS